MVEPLPLKISVLLLLPRAPLCPELSGGRKLARLIDSPELKLTVNVWLVTFWLLASMIACRSDPVPLSLPLVTLRMKSALAGTATSTQTSASSTRGMAHLAGGSACLDSLSIFPRRTPSGSRTRYGGLTVHQRKAVRNVFGAGRCASERFKPATPLTAPFQNRPDFRQQRRKRAGT